MDSISSFFVADVAVPGLVLVGLQADIEFAVEKAGRIGAIVGTSQLRADHSDLRIRHQDVANLRRNLAGFLERNGVRHGRPHPERAFIQVRHEFAADERNQQQGRAEDKSRNHQRGLGAVERPIQLDGVLLLHPFKGAVRFLADAAS